MISLTEIQHFLNAKHVSTDDISVQEAKSITDPSFGQNTIGWSSDQNGDVLLSLIAGNVIVSENLYQKYVDKVNRNVTLIPVAAPRLAFSKVLKKFFVQPIVFGDVHNSAVVHDSVDYEKSTVLIGHNVVIESGCKLGNRVQIGANTVIKSGTIIGDDCAIGSNCTIGSIGFGYERNEDGDYERIPHLGNVVIHNRVEISNNVCIDKAVMGSTVIGENVKIDNLVHIAHGVVIGKNSLIIANAMIAGSVKIGDNVWVAPSSSVLQKLNIGDDSIVGVGSVVVKHVDSNTVVAGNPAKVFPKK